MSESLILYASIYVVDLSLDSRTLLLASACPEITAAVSSVLEGRESRDTGEIAGGVRGGQPASIRHERG